MHIKWNFKLKSTNTRWHRIFSRMTFLHCAQHILITKINITVVCTCLHISVWSAVSNIRIKSSALATCPFETLRNTVWVCKTSSISVSLKKKAKKVNNTKQVSTHNWNQKGKDSWNQIFSHAKKVCMYTTSSHYAYG